MLAKDYKERKYWILWLEILANILGVWAVWTDVLKYFDINRFDYHVDVEQVKKAVEEEN